MGLVTGLHARSRRTHSQWVVGPGRTPERTSGRGRESARPWTPHTQARGAPPGHPHAAPTARKSARCGVGDGSPRLHPPHPQPVGSGPRPHAPTDERLGVGERPPPDTPHPGKRRPPLGTLMPPPQHARARAVGLVTGPRARTPRTHSQWVVGPSRTPERTTGRGWESARPGMPHTQAGGAPPGTPMPPPQRAKPARKSARCGVCYGSPRPHPPHPQPVGSGPWPHARADERSGVGERPSRDAPHRGRRRPPRAPSCRPHSAQSQLARARAVGLVTGPHARTPHTHSQWVVSPGDTPERTSGRGLESARPRTPHTQVGSAPPGHPHALPRARTASSQECALWGW